MGGTSIAVSDDEQALFSNPAALSTRREKAYALVDVNGEYNNDYSEIKNKTEKLSSADTVEGRAFNDRVLSEIMGKRARLQASNLVYYLGTQGFAVGILAQVLAETGVVRPTSPKIQSLQVTDTILAGSFSRPVSGANIIFRDQSKGWWGVSAKFINRNYLNREFYPRDFAVITKDDLLKNPSHGNTLDLDVGTFWALDNAWWQTVGLTAGNVFNNEIDPSIGNLKPWVALGTAIRPLSGNFERKQKLLLAADLWNVSDDISWFSKLRLGMEGKPRSWLTLRCGIRGGYWSGGLSAVFRMVHVDFASYSDETGPRPGDREDRRTSMSLSLNF